MVKKLLLLLFSGFFAVTLGLDSLVLCYELVLKLAKTELGSLLNAKYGFFTLGTSTTCYTKQVT